MNLLDLVEDAVSVVEDENGIVFRDADNEVLPSPPQDVLDKAREAAQAEYDSKQYARDRVGDYPSIGDQLDMIYHAGLGGDAFQAAIKAVKDAYPKPK